MSLTYTGLLTLAVIWCHWISLCNAQGSTYPFSFFNISTEKNEVGFVQVFACSPSESTVYFSMKEGIFNQYKLVEQISTFNLTLGYNKITVTGPPKARDVTIRPYGLIMSADSDTFVYAVKADVGTTDGYLIPTITTKSTEFIVSGWQAHSVDFFAGIMVVAALDDTCVETYLFSNNGTKLTFFLDTYLARAYSYAEIMMSNSGTIERESSILYVNSSRPISVISGVTCGQVTINNSYCDHMAEAIPPISELGTVHVVPPILGRNALSGYFVRVMASKISTQVTWTGSDGTTTDVIYPGNPYDIDTMDASEPILVTCDQPCLVMLYNKGVQAVATETSNTDPFMMLITPVNHYVNGSCFGTASFCYNIQIRTDFDNYLALATATKYTGDILFDNKTISGWSDIGEYSVAAFSIKHGFHTVTIVTGSAATFGGWVYGHSLFFESSSAYGYPIAYRILGQPISEGWKMASTLRKQLTATALVNVCQQENITNGSTVATYSISGTPWTVYQLIYLDGSLKTGVPLNSTCKTLYIRALRDFMTSTFRYINYQICSQVMCSSLTGKNGVVVSQGNFSGGILPTTLFVAIDTKNLENRITLDIQNNVLTGVHIVVPFVGSLDVNTDAFTQCRTEVRNFLLPFVNWMTLNNNGYVPASAASLSSNSTVATLTQLQKQLIANNQLLSAPGYCPSLSFSQPKFVYSTPFVCPSF